MKRTVAKDRQRPAAAHFASFGKDPEPPQTVKTGGNYSKAIPAAAAPARPGTEVDLSQLGLR